MPDNRHRLLSDAVLDDRFIAKELSRTELETMATFGPAYFDYMSSAVIANVSAIITE
jgi:1-phosphatidylinositol-3-phosphate 5-kinase